MGFSHQDLTDSNDKQITASEKENNSAVPDFASMIGADDGTNIKRLQGRIAPPIHTDYGLITRPVPYDPATFIGFASGVANVANKSMISIANTGSTVCRIHEIWLANIQTTAITGTMSFYELHRITSHSAGTLITAVANDTADTLGVGISVRTGATVAGEGATIFRQQWSNDEHGVGSLDQEGYDKAFQNAFPFYREGHNLKSFVIRQNQGLHIKQITGAVGTFDLWVVFSEATA
jgi:hypothetical protein